MCRTRKRGGRFLDHEPNGDCQATETKEGITDLKNRAFVPRLKAGEEAEHTESCEKQERDGTDDSD
jgi:hypothetical protein